MMISTRFSVAIHILSILSMGKGEVCTSEFIANSVHTNPVVIRRVTGMLKKAGLVNVNQGCGGASLVKSIEEMTLYEVYRAVQVVDEGKLFGIHDDTNQACIIGVNIPAVLQAILTKAQTAMEDVLEGFTMKDVVAGIFKENSLTE